MEAAYTRSAEHSIALEEKKELSNQRTQACQQSIRFLEFWSELSKIFLEFCGNLLMITWRKEETVQPTKSSMPTVNKVSEMKGLIIAFPTRILIKIPKNTVFICIALEEKKELSSQRS